MEGSKAREHFAVVAARPERLYTGAVVTERKPDTLGLAAAAEDLDRELSRYEALAGRIQHERLDSEKNLHQAARALSELEQSEGRLGEHLRALVDAIATARERQEKQSQGVRARAEQIRQRTESLTQLLERLAALGAAAGDVNRLVQQVAASAGEAGAPELARSRGYSLQAVVSRDSQLVQHGIELSQIGAHVRRIPKPDAYTGRRENELEVIGVTDDYRLASGIDDRLDVTLLHCDHE